MKTTFALAVVALFLAPAPGSCFALTDVITLTPQEAQDLGIEVIATGNPEAVSVAVEFALEGRLEECDGIWLNINPEGDSVISAPLKDGRTDTGHVTVSFYAHRDQLDTLSVRISVPGGPGVAGSTLYVLPMDDFVD